MDSISIANEFPSSRIAGVGALQAMIYLMTSNLAKDSETAQIWDLF
jgi:hypothetical protein